MAERKNWQRPEQMLALELYFITPFGKIHSRNPDIIVLADKIGRTPGALTLKMSNFAALDPTIDRKGMGNFSKTDALIWEEFFADPVPFLDKLQSLKTTEMYYSQVESPDSSQNELREGGEVLRLQKTRRNQDFFRASLLAAYSGKCALTAISQTELLIASHIVPWSENKEARVNPRNGILLNALHDRAFDSGLITFEDNHEMVVSKELQLSEMAKPFFETCSLRAPEKFGPDPIFLKHHRDKIFVR